MIVVDGVPAPQGSKTLFRNGGMRESSRKVAPWRAAVKAACLAQWDRDVIDGPVVLVIDFRFARPLSHLGTGRNAGTLRPSAREVEHTVYPDLDKVLRSTMDAITQSGVVWRDDAQVTHIDARKWWATPGDQFGPGASIDVLAFPANQPPL